MSEIPLLETKCGGCHLLVINEKLDAYPKYSCPRNRKGMPEMVPKFWATQCPSERGLPVTKQMKENNLQKTPVFFTKQFGIRVTPDYKTVFIIAKKGFKLAIDPSQSSEYKIVVTSLKEPKDA